AAGIEDLLEVRVDGIVARERHLAGKPGPDTFLEAAHMLGVAPGNAAVFEDALAGVEAGRAGRFGCGVGVDRPRPGAGAGTAALAGVEAGRAGRFGCVVGVDRTRPVAGAGTAAQAATTEAGAAGTGSRKAEALREHGADIVVRDLEDLLP